MPPDRFDGQRFAGCACYALAFRVQLTAGALEEVRATVVGVLTATGIAYAGRGVPPAGVGFVGVGDTGRWIWSIDNLLAGQRSAKLHLV
jgi:hypothetical protein